MRKLLIPLLFSAFICALAFDSCASHKRMDKAPEKKEILSVMSKANDFFINKYADPTAVTNVGKIRPSNIWTRSVYYEGLMAFYEINPDNTFLDYALRWAEFHNWGLNGGITTKNADNQCCGQIYLDLYALKPSPEKIKSINDCIDLVLEDASDADWTWIDAIQMAMPVFAKLGKIHGDDKYYEKMYSMYAFTRNNHGKDGLFNPEEGLWWRDKDFVPPYKSLNGENCYWSRGNGWVYAALVRILDIIPEDEPHRREYLADFRAMSKALIKCQREDGFWNVSLLDPEYFGGKETTGTSLFVYGLAYGINNGILDRNTYLPPLLKAWNGLVNNSIRTDGSLAYVQGTGKEPKDGQPVTFTSVPDFEDFGTGCFLLGASEMFKLK